MFCKRKNPHEPFTECTYYKNEHPDCYFLISNKPDRGIGGVTGFYVRIGSYTDKADCGDALLNRVEARKLANHILEALDKDIRE